MKSTILTLSGLLLVWFLTGLWVTSEKKIQEYIKQGDEARSKNPRPIIIEDYVSIVGWGGGNGLSFVKEFTQPLALALKTKFGITQFEVFVVDPDNNHGMRAQMNVGFFPVSGLVTVLVSIPLGNRFTSTDANERLKQQLAFGKQIAASLPEFAKLSGVACYVTARSVYTTYGDYGGTAIGWDPTRKRDWPSGERSPYIGILSLFPKPARFAHLSNMEWAMNVWWKTQAPVSEIIQPRAQYIRYVVLKREDTAPAFDGWVVEMFASRQHIENPFLFFNGRDIWETVVNLATIVKNSAKFSDLTSVQGSVVSEFIFD